jgi:hypothetical protein
VVLLLTAINQSIHSVSRLKQTKSVRTNAARFDPIPRDYPTRSYSMDRCDVMLRARESVIDIDIELRVVRRIRTRVFSPMEQTRHLQETKSKPDTTSHEPQMTPPPRAPLSAVSI